MLLFRRRLSLLTSPRYMGNKIPYRNSEIPDPKAIRRPLGGFTSALFRFSKNCIQRAARLEQSKFGFVLGRTRYAGGLNGSMQHSRRTRLALKTKAKSLAKVRSAEHYPG